MVYAPLTFQCSKNGAWANKTEPPPILVDPLNRHKEASYVAYDGKTSLHWVCSFQNFSLEIVKALLSAFPVAAMHRDSSGHIPLHIAYLSSSQPIIDDLEQKCPEAKLVRNNWGWTPEMMRALVKVGVTCPEIMNDNARPPSFQFFKEWNSKMLYFINNEGAFLTNPRLFNTDPPDNTVGIMGDMNQHGEITEAYRQGCLLLQTEVLGAPVESDPTAQLAIKMTHAALKVSSCPWVFFYIAIKINPQEVFMEDDDGYLPIHLAAMTDTSTDGEFYRCENCFRTPVKDPMYHCMLTRCTVYCTECWKHNRRTEEDNLENICQPCNKGPTAIKQLIATNPQFAKIPCSNGRLPLNLALLYNKSYKTGIQTLFRAAPEAICIRDIGTHMFPFMIAAASDADSDANSNGSPGGTLNQKGNDTLDKFTTIYELLMEAPHLVQSATL